MPSHDFKRLSIRAEDDDEEEDDGEEFFETTATSEGPKEGAALYGDISVERLGKDTDNITWYPKAADIDNRKKKWYIIDATGLRLGRLATQVSIILRGKNKPTYTPAADCGDYVIIINAEKIEVTGKKESQKLYKRHSGRPGGMKVEQLKALRERIPERIIEKAVWGMLPKGSLGRRWFTHLKVVKGAEHEHAAQQPIPLVINTIPKPAKKPLPVAA